MKREERDLFPNGADWAKCDFHLHSPFVDSFTLPPGINLDSEETIDELIQQYIDKLKEKEIKICSITDYQQIRNEWFTKFQSKAKESGIFVFPGIELSVTMGKGLHILLIFEYEQNIMGINDRIKALDKNPQNPLINGRKHRDIDLTENLTSVLQTLKKQFSCLIVFPHPEDDNGLLNVCQPKEAVRYLKLADAVELISETGINKLVSTGEIKNDFFTSHIAIIENTDPKSIDDIGIKIRNNKIRCTYLKLSSISLNAIRIAFQDPLLRVKKYDKPSEKIDCLTAIEITGSKFLKDVKIDFNSNLNCFIGGRGVGKTALIESIRYCLDLPIYAEKSFKQEFVPNVIGSGGEITIKLSKRYGDQLIPYTFKRIIGQEAKVIEKEISPNDLFEENAPVLFGQKELYELSKNEEFQRQLIDQLIGDEIKQEKLRFQKGINLLEENADKLLDIEKKLVDKENKEQRLKAINEQIKTFKELGVAEKMEKFTKLTKDNKALENAIEKFTDVKKSLIEKYEEYIQELEISCESLDKGESIEKEILKNTGRELKEFVEFLKIQFQNISNEITKTEKKLNNIKNEWNINFELHKNETESIKKELSERGLSPDKYEALIKEKANLESLLNEYRKIEDEEQQLIKERNRLKDEIQKERHSVFSLRQKRIDELNNRLNGRVKLEINYLTDKKEFIDKLTALFRGSGISESSISNIVNSPHIAIDGIEISKAILKGAEEVKQKFQLTEAMTNRLLDWFKNNNRLFVLETLFPEDLITINLKVGDEYKPFYIISDNGDKIYQLSDGQRATALLILLFSQQNRILIIDQPEEDLDNRFIYDDVVLMLREMKGKRQMIFATHNANIPVLGDSEQVIVLDTKDDRCVIRNSGSIDKLSISDDIKKIMEGGEEAFKKRIQKYGVKYE